MNTARKNYGKVIIAGAGPGDPELITLKALRYLREADTIITDRLVSQELFPGNVKIVQSFFTRESKGAERNLPHSKGSMTY